MVEIIKAKKTGRNDPCPCESGKKFKRCCMPKSEVEQRLSQQGLMAIFRQIIKEQPDGLVIKHDNLLKIPMNEGIAVTFDIETDEFTLRVVEVKKRGILTPNKRIVV